MIEADNILLKKNQRCIIAADHYRIKPASLNMVIGANGAGKTSFLRCLAGLEEDYCGEVRIADLRLRDLSLNDRARQIAWVPERNNIPFSFRVLDVACMGRFPWNYGFSGAEDLAFCKKQLDLVGLLDLQLADVNTLSSGELRKLMIARALCQDTKTVILDEPCANLDAASIRQLMQIIKKLALQNEKTFVLSTHDMNVVRIYADQVALIQKSKLVAQGEPHSILQHPAAQELIL